MDKVINFAGDPNIRNVANNLSEVVQQQLINLAISTIVQDSPQENKMLHSIKEASGLSTEILLDLLGLYIHIVKAYMESDEKEFNKILLDCGFSREFVAKLPLKPIHKPLTPVVADSELELPIQWKIDISVSKGILGKQVSPSVIASLNLNKKKHIINMDFQTFHKLRYNVALMLKELDTLKKSKTLRN